MLLQLYFIILSKWDIRDCTIAAFPGEECRQHNTNRWMRNISFLSHPVFYDLPPRSLTLDSKASNNRSGVSSWDKSRWDKSRGNKAGLPVDADEDGAGGGGYEYVTVGAAACWMGGWILVAEGGFITDA